VPVFESMTMDITGTTIYKSMDLMPGIYDAVLVLPVAIILVAIISCCIVVLDTVPLKACCMPP
jgi:hypothetical protein